MLFISMESPTNIVNRIYIVLIIATISASLFVFPSLEPSVLHHSLQYLPIVIYY
jgi:hypothetical protein